MKNRFIDEKTGIEYIKQGDYYIPNIVVPTPRRTGNIGKYGRMREKYLKEHRGVEYTLMKVNNELRSHLLDIDDICKERIEKLVKQMAEQEKVNEELKARNQLEWVQQMNNIRNRAEEIVMKEVVYEEVYFFV